MEKILKILHFLFSMFVDACLIFGLIVVALYFIWGVTPQTVIEKTGYFFSESWGIVSGHERTPHSAPIVTQKQVDAAKEHIHYR